MAEADRKIFKYLASSAELVNISTPDTQVHNVQKLTIIRYVVLDIYRRLFSIVLLVNIALLIFVLLTGDKLRALVNAAGANLMACGLARQPIIINLIFWIVCAIPRTWPFRIRRIAASVYHYGGVHSGCGIASLVWYIATTVTLTVDYISGKQNISSSVIALTYTLLVLLLIIIAVSYPTFRAKFHDYFELTHRFFSWISVILFLALLIKFTDDVKNPSESLGRAIVNFASFWFLITTLCAIIHPWILLRKIEIQPEKLSNHAIRLHFDHTTTSFGKGIQLARHPLRDWHSFATFPDPTRDGFSCLVSKAGDWTADCINRPPSALWKRGILIYGFAYVMRLFRRVVVVTMQTKQ
ncbi:hypothetical protein V1511DRAFT_200815 [Dipodascopsis uninucleata]